MHDNRARISADDAGNVVTDRDRHVPPAFGPSAHATCGPGVSVFVQPFVSSFRHSAEAVGDQVNGLLENWEFGSPF